MCQRETVEVGMGSPGSTAIGGGSGMSVGVNMYVCALGGFLAEWNEFMLGEKVG